jgi:hypothetical protein
MAYRTLMDWDEGQNWVILKRDGVEVAKMTLDEWMELHAVRFAAGELAQIMRTEHLPPETAGTAASEATPPARRNRARAGASSPE